VIVTNAHVVAGEADPQVDEDGTLFQATPILFDPKLDLALLRTSAPMGQPLQLDPGTVPRGTEGAIVGYPENGPLTVTAAGIATQVSAVTRDIYDQGVVTKEVYEVDGVVQPGNSGSPLLTASGQVVGVVFSRSTTSPDVGYALTSPEVLNEVVRAENDTARVSTQGCSPD
jgi:S1-C subfamily serine protease